MSTIIRMRGDLPDLAWPPELDAAREFCLDVRDNIPNPIYGPAYNDWARTFAAASARCAQLFAVSNGLRRAAKFNPVRLVGIRSSDVLPAWCDGLGEKEYCVRGDGFAAAPAMMICHSERIPDLAGLPDSLVVDMVERGSWREPGDHLVILRRGLPTVAEAREEKAHQ